MKVALMRWLVSPSPYGRGYRLGVIWFQDPKGHDHVDGDHLTYLHPSHDGGEELRSLDPVLYDRLRQVSTRAGRALSVHETCRELPTDSVRFDRPLTFEGLLRDDAAARVVTRQRWFHEALVAVAPCSLVFLDSDEGVADVDTQRPSTELAADAVSMSEVARLLERGQSVVTHQLVERAQVLPDAITTSLNDIHRALGAEPLALVLESDDSTRLFTVIPHECHRSDMHARIGALQLSRWGDEFRVHRWRPSLISA